jgi:aspartyl-tRNA(Asn)/glutamyl-tRNA(Gln) amidotransferase subunit C
MAFSRDQLDNVARLARLQINEEERNFLPRQIDDILSYIEKLGEINTEGVQPTSHVLLIKNAFREDEITPSLERKDIFLNAPEHNGELFKVPKVL